MQKRARKARHHTNEVLKTLEVFVKTRKVWGHCWICDSWHCPAAVWCCLASRSDPYSASKPVVERNIPLSGSLNLIGWGWGTRSQVYQFQGSLRYEAKSSQQGLNSWNASASTSSSWNHSYQARSHRYLERWFSLSWETATWRRSAGVRRDW